MTINRKGTIVFIYLPATEKNIEEKKVLPHGLVKGNETVLLVDDEKMVLEIGSLMLQKLGYSVLIASNGHKAIKILKKNKVAFVILDLRMPDMNGVEIYPLLKNIQPNFQSQFPGS